jgi:hypothetical protein
VSFALDRPPDVANRVHRALRDLAVRSDWRRSFTAMARSRRRLLMSCGRFCSLTTSEAQSAPSHWSFVILASPMRPRTREDCRQFLKAGTFRRYDRRRF